MHYVAFGQGTRPLVIIPGLGDGLQTVKGQGKRLATYYKAYAKDYRVYVLSRKERMEEGCTTRAMAADVKAAMEHLEIKPCCVMGISQGGMIAQYLAIDFPQAVSKLVIGVSTSRPNDTVEQVVSAWIKMAKAGDYRTLLEDTLQKTFTEKTFRRYKPLVPILTRIGKPTSFDRFIVQAKACLAHQSYEQLNRIQCPTLVIGGGRDSVVGENTSQEMAQQIGQAQLVLYPELGHGAYEEAENFNSQVMAFLRDEMVSP